MNANVLTISHSEGLVKDISKALANTGGEYNNVGYNSLSEVIAAISEQWPSIILIDTELGEDVCISVVNEINANYKQKEISLISILRHNTFPIFVSLQALGIDDFVVYPFNEGELLIRVNLASERTKRMAKILLESEQFSDITQAASSAGSSLLIINSKGEITWVNDGFERLYGTNLQDFKNKFGENLFSPTMKPVTQQAMQRCRNGEYVIYDSLWITPNNERKYIQTSLTPIYDTEGLFSKIIAIETDITELKSAEEALIEKNDYLLSTTEHLEKANELLDEQRAQIESQKASLEEEMNKSEALLKAILPDIAAHQLKKKGFVKPKNYKEASVMFADFVSFSKIANVYEEIEDLLAALGFYFEKFDEITTLHFIEKIKTIGDCYMCVGGVPQTNKSHPFDTVIAALKIQKFVEEAAVNDHKVGKPIWKIRIGIHTGSLVGGVIGKKRFAYDIWGDTVNIASRMESSGDSGKVNISDATYQYVKDYFECKYRGKVPAKNFGEINMYYVERIKPEYSEDEDGFTPNAAFRKVLSTL
jgi:PAS domain S-box-containing protein